MEKSQKNLIFWLLIAVALTVMGFLIYHRYRRMPTPPATIITPTRPE